MKLVIEDEAAQRKIMDMTELALKTGTYPSLLRRLHYLSEYSTGGREQVQVIVTGTDGGDGRRGYSVGILFQKRDRPSQEWQGWMVGGLVYHEGAEREIAWSVHT